MDSGAWRGQVAGRHGQARCEARRCERTCAVSCVVRMLLSENGFMRGIVDGVEQVLSTMWCARTKNSGIDSRA
jgi:hypothetical protein